MDYGNTKISQHALKLVTLVKASVLKLEITQKKRYVDWSTGTTRYTEDGTNWWWSSWKRTVLSAVINWILILLPRSIIMQNQVKTWSQIDTRLVLVFCCCCFGFVLLLISSACTWDLEDYVGRGAQDGYNILSPAMVATCMVIGIARADLQYTRCSKILAWYKKFIRW